MGICYTKYLKKKKSPLEISVLGCWGEVARIYPLQLRLNTYLISVVTRAHVVPSLLKLFITDFYVYFVFVKSLR